jgi:hypothetical protein
MAHSQVKREEIFSSIKHWQIFDRVLNLHYNFEELLFYLYSRHLFEHFFSESAKFKLS